MDVAGKMNRTFPVNRVPVGWICAARKLNFQPESCGCFRCIPSDNARCRFPGSATGGTSSDGNFLDFTLRNLDIQFRCTELVSIRPQAVLPGKAASSGWGHDMFRVVLFSGSHQRNFFFGTDLGQIIGQVGVF